MEQNREVIAERSNKLIYREGDKVFKVFYPPFTKSNVLNEALNMARIEETGLRIPKLLDVTKIDGNWAIVTEYIDGATLQEIMDSDPDSKQFYLERFVNLQMDIHDLRAPRLNKLREKMEGKINEAKIDATTRYELHARLAGMPKHEKVCHGDFNPSNVIVDANGDMYVLDWAHVTQGNASADIARTYLLFCLAGDEETAEQYLETFTRLSATPQKYVRQWMPIVAASQSVKEKPEQREFLLRWADVVEYV